MTTTSHSQVPSIGGHWEEGLEAGHLGHLAQLRPQECLVEHGWRGQDPWGSEAVEGSLAGLGVDSVVVDHLQNLR